MRKTDNVWKVSVADIVAELDQVLRLGDFDRDVSNNGLQVEGAHNGVSKICLGVDASPEFYCEAIKRGAQMLIVHHGISWGASLARITGANYRLVAPLVQNDIALFAAHLPLDAHPTLGNNAGLASALGLVNLQGFGTYAGYTIGMKGEFAKPRKWDEVLRRIQEVCPDGRFEHIDSGKKLVKTVGVISGGAGADFVQAIEAGLDAYITGEISLQEYNIAINSSGVNYAAAGHYATERFGVCLLGDYLADRFGIECEFIDMHLKY